MRRETTTVMTIVIALVTLGVLMVYSASAVNAEFSTLLKKQLIALFIGSAAMLVASRFDYHHFAKPRFFCAVVGFAVLSLVLVLLPGVGREVDGGRRWILIPVINFNYQPSEFAKFAVIVAIAHTLTTYRERVTTFLWGFLLPLSIACLFAVLVLAERDLGVPVIMMGVAYIMMSTAGTRWRYLMLSAAPAAGLLWLLVLWAPHRMIRLLAFLDPWNHRDKAGWQLIQSFSAFARGSLTGLGAGASEQKLGYLPAAHTDFIFAVVGEEFGLVGTLTVVSLFAILLVAAVRIAMNAQDLFGALLAVGITGLITMQAVFIMAVTTGLLPTKGLPLPFISYGGTSLIVFLGLIGVLVNVGVQAQDGSRERRLIPAV